jgi:hypothetical protein
MTLERGAIEELGVRPDRGHGRELVDDDPLRRLAAKHRQQGNGRIVAAALVDRGFAAFGNKIQDGILVRRLFGAKPNRPSARVLVWASCLGSPALAAHSVTVDLASRPPLAWTCRSMRTAAAAGPDAKPSNPTVNSMAMICTLLSLHIFAFRIRELSMN